MVNSNSHPPALLRLGADRRGRRSRGDPDAERPIGTPRAILPTLDSLEARACCAERVGEPGALPAAGCRHFTVTRWVASDREVAAFGNRRWARDRRRRAQGRTSRRPLGDATGVARSPALPVRYRAEIPKDSAEERHAKKRRGRSRIAPGCGSRVTPARRWPAAACARPPIQDGNEAREPRARSRLSRTCIGPGGLAAARATPPSPFSRRSEPLTRRLSILDSVGPRPIPFAEADRRFALDYYAPGKFTMRAVARARAMSDGRPTCSSLEASRDPRSFRKTARAPNGAGIL